MSTALISHVACLAHDTGLGHPECPDRLRAVMQALEGEEFQFLARHDAPRATGEQLLRVHTKGLVDGILDSLPEEGLRYIDSDTVLSPGSGEAALRAAGAVCLAVDLVMAGKAINAFCAVRPPGHHAEADRAMGFCLFNNIAVGAAHARAAHGIERVAIIDFDVHHGNGTQAIFWGEPGVFYASTHEFPCYPGTGRAEETGVAGNILNLPMAPYSKADVFRALVSDSLIPALDAFRPELVMISAGFDAHLFDPLATVRLENADFAWVTRQLAAVAERHCGRRLVSSLEGGYDLGALGQCAAIHVRELMLA